MENFAPHLLKAMEDESITGPINCVNVYKFKDVPDYPDDFEGVRHETGREAHAYYRNLVNSFPGVELVFYGNKTPGMPVWSQEGMDFEAFDSICIVRYSSKEAMLSMMMSHEYQEIAPVREASVTQAWTSFSDTQRAEPDAAGIN